MEILRAKQRVESRKNSGIIRIDSDNIYFVLWYRLVPKVDAEVSEQVSDFLQQDWRFFHGVK
jgi:hypothetical protein